MVEDRKDLRSRIGIADSGSLVSVIVPTHNRWPMVGEAVDSVLGQAIGEYELIVVDDGSTDATRSRLREYGERLSLLSQSRRGVGAARNLGASRASGRYLAFLDSDDLWHPRKLQRQLDFMERNPDAEICQTDEIWIRNGVRVNPRRKHRKPSGDIFRASLDLCLVSPSAVMMRRELFEWAGGFDESLPVCEDYDLWLRISKDTEVPLIPEALVTKRGGHADQLSRSTWGFDRFRVQAIANLIEAGLDPEKAGWALEAMSKKVTILAQGFRKRGNEAMALEYEERLRRAARRCNATALHHLDSRFRGNDGGSGGMTSLVRRGLEQPVNEMTLSEEITNYARERGIRAQDVQRWLALGEADQAAMLRLARNLRLGGNHFNDFLEWCVEISLRDACSIASVIDGAELAPTLSDSRMGRNDKLKHAKEALRRLRYPRLTRIEDEVRGRLRSLKLDPRIRITVAPGLEGGLKVEMQAGGVEALARLAREVESLADNETAREVFALMEGKEGAGVSA